MSDGKEVKRWELNPGNGCTSDRCYAEISVQPDGDYVLLSDHDRIVAQHEKQFAEYCDRVGDDIQHLNKTIAELRAEVERLTGEVVRRNQYKLNQEMLDVAHKVYEERIARQAREAEVLKVIANEAEAWRNACAAQVVNQDEVNGHRRKMFLALNEYFYPELAAIERAEGEKEHE